MQKITPTINYIDKISESDYKTMKEVFSSIIDNPDLQVSKDICEHLEKVYKIEPAYAINDDIQICNPQLQKGDIYAVKKRHFLSELAIPHLEKAIILLYQILKKIYDSELQQDCNPLNYIIFDNPDDYRFLDSVIKEILPND